MRAFATELRASIELNTPAVLGGARPLRADPYFVLRPSSVRGGLRYWFRAAAASMLWPVQARTKDDQRARDEEMLEELRALEASVFGDTKGSSRVLLLPPDGGIAEPWRPLPDSRNQKGLWYLGYGLFDAKGRPPERLVTRGRPLTVRLRLRDDRPELREMLAASLWLWTAFGGLGARGRRGYGSMQLVGLHDDKGAPSSRFAKLVEPLARSNQEHLERLQLGIGLAQDAVKELVSVSRHGQAQLEGTGSGPHPNIRTIDGITSLWTLHGETDDPMDALDLAGSLMQRYRSSLARKTPLPDYHAVKQSLKPPYRPPTAVDRAAFGLPLNFYFRSLGGAKTQFLPRRPENLPRKRDDSDPDRLASPLLVRVHAIAPHGSRRLYGVTLVNLAGRSNTTPLLGCGLKQAGSGGDGIERPSARILDAFAKWAQDESKRQPLQPRRSKQGGPGK